MYHDHVPILREHAATPAGLQDILTFSFMSAHQAFAQMNAVMGSVRRDGEDSPFLTEAKRRGLRYVKANAERLHRVHAEPLPDVMAEFTAVPGLGLVKAGFAAQMLGHNVACLDTHNLVQCGLDYNVVRLDKTVGEDTRRRKIADYIELCQSRGHASKWWDAWCEYVADPTGTFPTAQDVSRYHVTCIKGETF